MPGRQSPHKTMMVAARRLRVSELYRAGKNQYEMAEILTPDFPTRSGAPISQQTISGDLKHIRAEWRSSRESNFDSKIDLELARIDQIEASAWRCFEGSIGKYETITTKTTSIKQEQEAGCDIDLPAEEKTIKTEKLNGDPKYLAIALDCVKKRCEILGLNSAQKLANADGSNISGINITYMTPAVAPDGQ